MPASRARRSESAQLGVDIHVRLSPCTSQHRCAWPPTATRGPAPPFGAAEGHQGSSRARRELVGVRSAAEGTINGERGLGDVGREDDLTPRLAPGVLGRRRRVENLPLAVHWQGGVERQHDDVRDLVAEIVDLGLCLLACILDLLLSCQEDEDVALGLAAVDAKAAGRVKTRRGRAGGACEDEAW